MTLGSSIRLSSPVPPMELLDHLTILVGGDPATVKRRGPEAAWDDTGTFQIANCLGQGFAAIVDVSWCPDGPLPVRSKWHDDGEPDWPAGCVAIWLDTNYSYKGPGGESCVQLHQRLAREALAFARKRDPAGTGTCMLDIWGEWWDIDTMEDKE